jgi:hypothetical protein
MVGERVAVAKQGPDGQEWIMDVPAAMEPPDELWLEWTSTSACPEALDGGQAEGYCGRGVIQPEDEDRLQLDRVAL